MGSLLVSVSAATASSPATLDDTAATAFAPAALNTPFADATTPAVSPLAGAARSLQQHVPNHFESSSNLQACTTNLHLL